MDDRFTDWRSSASAQVLPHSYSCREQGCSVWGQGQEWQALCQFWCFWLWYGSIWVFPSSHFFFFFSAKSERHFTFIFSDILKLFNFCFYLIWQSFIRWTELCSTALIVCSELSVHRLADRDFCYLRLFTLAYGDPFLLLSWLAVIDHKPELSKWEAKSQLITFLLAPEFWQYRG